ncbi:MAG: hypothetical protein ACRDRJ_15860 [Streptosporangiaceae bacterium]
MIKLETRLVAAVAAVAAALTGCGGTGTRAARPTATTLSQVGLACTINMPGVAGPGESLSITADNTLRIPVRVFLDSVQVGGYEGVSGNYAGPDTVTVNRWVRLRPKQSKSYGPFPVSDRALENVGAAGGICLNGGTVIGK